MKDEVKDNDATQIENKQMRSPDDAGAYTFHSPPPDIDKPTRSGRPRCRVLLLDGQYHTFAVDKKAKAFVAINEVFRHLDLKDAQEKEFFSIYYIDTSGCRFFLNPFKQIRRQLPNASSRTTWDLYFGVQFYATELRLLADEITVYQYVLQICRDIKEKRIKADHHTKLELVSLLVQANCGDYDPKEHTPGYVDPYIDMIYNPSDIPIGLSNSVSEEHKRKTGLKPNRANDDFFTKAKGIYRFGQQVFPVQDHRGQSGEIGAALEGLYFHKDGKQFMNIPWKDVITIGYHNKKIRIRYHPKGSSDKEMLYLYCSWPNAKLVWRRCVEQHNFFRLSIPTPLVRSRYSFNRNSRSKLRFSRGRTLYQMLRDERKSKLIKAIASVKEKKEELARIPPANLNTPSVKAKLDQLNAFQISLKEVSSQMSEVMTLGQQLKDSCADVDPELDKRLKELTVLWTELNSDLQQRIQNLQNILLRLEQFHQDLGKFLTWIYDVNSNLQAAPPPGVEPPEVEKKITKLEKVKGDVTCHQPELVTLFQAADELMAEANDPRDTTCDKLRHYKEDMEKHWNSLEEAVTKRRGQLEKALEKAEEFRLAFQKETTWLNSADDRLTMEWSPRGLPGKCKEELEQHKVFIVQVHVHNELIKALMPLGEGLKPQGSKAEEKMVDTWLKELQDGASELDKAMMEKEGQLQAALREAEHFEGSYNIIIQWVDTSTKAQEEAEPIKSELDSVQKRLEIQKATLKEASAKKDELKVIMTAGQSLNNKCIKEDGEVIIKLLKELRTKWDNLDTLLTHRKTQLEEMLLMLGQFQQDFDELWVWLTTIHAQLSNPSSISGEIDTVNTMITKHSAIQKQLEAKQSTLEVVSKAGRQALSQKSKEDTEILQKKLDELEQKWNEVSQMSANWQQRLENTRDELRQFNVLIVPLQKFLDKVTPRLSPSEPVYGNKDTVERLIDSHKQLQKELDGQIEKVEATKTSGDKLVNDLLDNPEPVKGSLELMSNRWDEAWKASEIRQKRLDQALVEAKEFEANYDDALEWVKIKSDQFTSQLVPQEDATALQKQIEEQKAYSDEILAKQPEIDKVLEKGEQLLKEAHPDAVPILQNMIQELQYRWRKLNKMASDCSEELRVLLELQGVEEMLIQLAEWVKRARKTLADKQAEPIGKTLKEIEAQLAVLESFQKDIEAQKPNIEELQRVADRGGNQGMIRKINDLYKKWLELKQKATDRHTVLTDARKKMTEAESFDYDHESWRRKFMNYCNGRYLKLSDLFNGFSANCNGKLIINRKQFIKALKDKERSDFRMSKDELEKVADVFFPDQTAQRLVKDVLSELKKKQDNSSASIANTHKKTNMISGAGKPSRDPSPN